MRVKVASTKRMTTEAWEKEEKPNWWIKCKDGSGVTAEIVGWARFPATPGCEYLEVVVNVDVRTKYVDIGCGKLKGTKVRENDIKVTQIPKVARR